MKKNTWNYNEKDHTDKYEDVVDLDSGNLIKDKVSAPKNKTAMQLIHVFSDMSLDRIKVRPMPTKGSYFLMLNALKELEPKQIVEMMDEWFSSGKEKADLLQITQCISVNQVNRYKGRKNQ